MTHNDGLVVNFDGVYLPHAGGRAAYGYVVRVQGWPGSVLVHQQHGDVGRGAAMSNNVAEYAGLVAALEWLASEPARLTMPITCKGDSQLVIQQMSGKWHVRGGRYLGQYTKARKLASKFKRLRFQWVPRAQNAEADAVASGRVCSAACWCGAGDALGGGAA